MFLEVSWIAVALASFASRAKFMCRDIEAFKLSSLASDLSPDLGTNLLLREV
jgi:hypothetical protein